MAGARAPGPEAAPERALRGALIDWLREQELLRGPYLFVDYWANVLGLESIIPTRQVETGLIEPALFRLGIDRPELDLPRLTTYLLLMLVGPVLLVSRSFRRLGRYPLDFTGERARAVLERLEPYRLHLERVGARRVDVRLGDTTLARSVLDPHLVAGFSSLFWAVNKLPLASLSAILLVAILAPALHATGLLIPLLEYWVLVGFPVLVLLLYAIYREWGTAVLGALPVLIGRYLLIFFEPTAAGGGPFFLALAGLFLLYLAADWLFIPRPVPPVLLLYTAEGPGHPYAREGDAPYWLEGKAYWVWRYMLLSPAEVNKFWERDWERVELWIRADGPEAGTLEWVVSDLHYREVWFPLTSLGSGSTMARHRQRALEAVERGEPGVWLLEVDADLLFHYPVFRGASFLYDRSDVPVRGIAHILRALRARLDDHSADAARARLDTVRLERGIDVLGDLPELIVPRAAERLLSLPWRWWRYPLGANRPRQPRVYDEDRAPTPPPAADPGLQVKASRVERRHSRG